MSTRFVFLLALMGAARVHSESVSTLPPAVSRPVDFAHEVAPLLRERCASCHGRGKSEGDFQIDDRESLLRGGVSGDAVVVGASGSSYLIELVAGVDPDNIMPEKGKRLNAEEVGLLRAWIDQGAPWDEAVTFEKPDPLNLEPKSDTPPEVPGVSHPIDRWLAPYFDARGVDARATISDAQFARRTSLDTIGLAPSPDALDAFINDDAADKRTRWVEALLADRFQYASHWMAFWNDLLRNDYSGTGFIDGGRRQITTWLWDALASNKPYDQFVRELVAPVPGSEGFTKGIVWRGVVNASQRPEMQAAQSISQVFLGVNLKCASCHNSFIDDWRLEDAYGMASVYSDEALTIVECDKPTEEIAAAGFLFPSLGAIDPELSRTERAQRLAALMVAPENGRTTRTLVNRIWARYFGRGLVEPLDAMDTPSWYPELLDWLAEAFVEQGYDVQWLMRTIMTSAAYAMPAQAIEEDEDWDGFNGPLAKRLGAEAFWDNLDRMTGLERAFPANRELDFFAGLNPSERQARLPEALKQGSVVAAPNAETAVYWLRRDWEFGEPIAEALAVVSSNVDAQWFVDGQSMGSSRPNQVAMSAGSARFASGSRHVVGLELRRKGNPEEPEPIEVWGYFRILGEDGARLEFSINETAWRGRLEAVADWASPDLEADGWGPPTPTASSYQGAQWLDAARVEALYSQMVYRGAVRASLVNNDPLMLTLGRTNREQVVTRREERPTTLQALALTNGQTFIQRLRDGAAQWYAQRDDASLKGFARYSFRYALSREPTERELQVAREILGEAWSVDGVEDWLWTLMNLPEFQFIY